MLEKVGAIITSEVSFRACVYVFTALVKHRMKTDEVHNDLKDLSEGFTGQKACATRWSTLCGALTSGRGDSSFRGLRDGS